jgi:glycosyltransferase involved in cell wall biosynthesis
VRAISRSSFTLVCNGVDESPPTAPIRDFLRDHGAQRVTTIYHPLDRGDEPRHHVTVYERGREARERSVRLPSRPPLTYVFDPFVPLRPERTDCWIGFNNLAAGRGLVQRRAGRADTVVYWPIDFVPDRFGRGLLTTLYDRLDALCCRDVDARFELSAAALEGRNARHGLEPSTVAPAWVAPIGAWLARVPTTPENGWKARRIIFVGHLVRRQGVGKLVEALGVLARRGQAFIAEIAGRGPLEDELRTRISRLGLEDRVRLVGFIPSHSDLERFVAAGSVGVAAYEPTSDSFTRFADPSKIRTYMAAGLPVVMTDVPPNASELAEKGGAEIVRFDAVALADALERALGPPEQWLERRRAALAYAAAFDWERILGDALTKVGFTD